MNNYLFSFQEDEFKKHNKTFDSSNRYNDNNSSAEKTKKLNEGKKTNFQKSKDKTEKNNNYTDGEYNYKDMLEQKIRKQANRLYELENYKTLCEHRILQIYPNQILPVKETDCEKYKECRNSKEKHYDAEIQIVNNEKILNIQNVFIIF